jgi:hypothetical protein
MKAMILATLAVCATTAAIAQVPSFEEQQRQSIMFQQQERQARIERARETCVRQRGVDCSSMEGLQEWLLLDRSRAEAVLDRTLPPPIVMPQVVVPSSSTGASTR